MSVITTTPELTQGGRHRAPETSRMRGNPWWTPAAVSIGVIMVGLDASVVAIANPRIATDLIKAVKAAGRGESFVSPS